MEARDSMAATCDDLQAVEFAVRGRHGVRGVIDRALAAIRSVNATLDDPPETRGVS